MFILIFKVLMMVWYFISQLFYLLTSFEFKDISPKEIWFDGWKKYRYDLFMSPTPRDAMWGFFKEYSDFFLDKQEAYHRSKIWRHLV